MKVRRRRVLVTRLPPAARLGLTLAIFLRAGARALFFETTEQSKAEQLDLI